MVTVYIIFGGIIGWLASIVMRTDTQPGILLNILVGIAGSFIGGTLLGSKLGSSAMIGWASGFLVAVILLAVVHIIRRGSLR